MIDQSHIDLLTLLSLPWKRAGATNGGEYHAPCEFCGGGDRFIIWNHTPEGGRWWCRQCGLGGDAIALLMARGLSFKDACHQLSLEAPESQPTTKPRLPQPSVHLNDLRDDYLCFDQAWQDAAQEFMYACGEKLWGGWDALAAGRYLEGRGITRAMATAACLGINTTEYRAAWGSAKVWLPRGITIPWEIDGQVWNIRLRRPNADLKEDDAKYISTTGCANGIYRVNRFQLGWTVYLTEGEFDALVLERVFRERHCERTSALSIGSFSGGRLLRWAARLALAERVVLVFDNDPAGDLAAKCWTEVLPSKAVRLRPTKKDVTEMWQAGALAGWIGEVL